MSENIDYISVLNNPVLIKETDKKIFQKWVDENPSTPIFRVLLAAKYQLDESDEVQKYIQEAAFYVQDRKRFKKLLRVWLEETELNKEVVVLDVDSTDTLVEGASVVELEETDTHTETNETVEQEGISPKVETLEDNKVVGETVESQTLVSQVEIVNTDIDWLLPWIDDFQVDFTKTSSEKEAVQLKETSHEKPTITEHQEEIRVQDVPEELEDSNSQSQIDSSENSDIKTFKTTQDSHSFDEWLSILEQKKKGGEEAPVFDLPIPDVLENESIQGSDTQEPIVETSNSDVNEQAVKELAHESISFNDDFATETLAKLYEIQGKKEQAIHIYQQLIEKYPKKSTYFANQIKKLR